MSCAPISATTGCSVPSTVEIGSEVRYRSPVFGPNDLIVAVSQSGETADTLAAVKSARASGAKVPFVAAAPAAHATLVNDIKSHP